MASDIIITWDPGIQLKPWETHTNGDEMGTLRAGAGSLLSWTCPMMCWSARSKEKRVSGELLKGSFGEAVSIVTVTLLIRKSLTVIFFCYFNYSLISEELFWIYGTFLTWLFWHLKVTQIQGLHNMASVSPHPFSSLYSNSKQRSHLFSLKTSALVFVFPLIIVPQTYIISLPNLLIKAFCRHSPIHLQHYSL